MTGIEHYLDAFPVSAGDAFKIEYAGGIAYLVCGDASSKLAYQHAPPQFDLLLTDPPYGVSYSRKTAMLNQIDGGKRLTTELAGDMGQHAISSVLSLAASKLASGAPFYVFSPMDRDICAVIQALNNAKLPVRRTLIWVKNRFVISWADYKYQHEVILYGWKLGARHRWYGPRNASTVLEHKAEGRNRYHPTQKPIALLTELINNSSRPGDWLLDPFAGGASTAIAALEASRNCYCIELVPVFVAAVLARMKNLGYTITRI